jgi:hypothetical protein
MGVIVVVVVLMMRFVADILLSSSSSNGSRKLTDVGRSVGDGGSDRVVDGGVGVVVIFQP